MTRFHIIAILAVFLGGLALLVHNSTLFFAVAAFLLVAIALGSAIPQMRFFGPFVCRANVVEPCVALTFDDGPDARSTSALLALLREARVEAAFFCIGARVEANPALATRMAAEGHLVENHSFTHSKVMNFFTIPRLRVELSRTQQVIKQATGVAPRWFRPPMGLSNPNVFRAARALGVAVVGWSTRGLDTKLAEPEKIVERILRGLQPGAIILLHDGNIPAERLVATVKLLLDSLRRLGYEVVRLDRMLSMKTESVAPALESRITNR